MQSSLRRFLQPTNVVVLIRLGAMGLALLVNIILTRLLGPEAFGRYSFILAIITLVCIPGQFGIPPLLIREASKAKAEDALDQVWSLKAWAYRLSLRISVPLLAVFVCACLLVRPLMPQGEAASFMLAAILIVVLPLSVIRAGLLRGLDKIVIGQAIEYVVHPVAFIALLFGFWALLPGREPFNERYAIIAYVIAACIAWTIGAIVLRRFMHRFPRPADSAFRIEGWKSSVLAFGLSSALLVIDTQVGVLILGVLSSDEDVGVYRVAAQAAVLTSLGYSAINASITPQISRAFVKNDLVLLERLAIRGSRYSVLFAGLIGAVLIAAGPALLQLVFGEAFGRAWELLVILVLAQLANGAFGATNVVLNMTGHEKYNTYGFAFGLLLSIVGAILLVPILGAVGGALSAAISMLARNVYLWLITKRSIGVETGFWGRVPQTATGG